MLHTAIPAQDILALDPLVGDYDLPHVVCRAPGCRYRNTDGAGRDGYCATCTARRARASSTLPALPFAEGARVRIVGAPEYCEDDFFIYIGRAATIVRTDDGSLAVKPDLARRTYHTAWTNLVPLAPRYITLP